MPTNYLEYYYQYYYQLPHIKYFHESGIAFLKQPDTKSLLIFYLDIFSSSITQTFQGSSFLLN